jgi:large subunit ribosomal protein L25
MSPFTVQRRSRSTSKPKQLRRQGLLPMALVERSHETMLIQAPLDTLREAMRHTDGLGRLEIQIDGEPGARKAIVKHIEQDALRHELMHVTLQEVADDDQVRLDVPVIARGEPQAMADGDLMLMAVTDHVKLRGRLSDMPDHVEVDVSGLQPGQHIEAHELQLPEGIDLVSAGEATLFSLRMREQAVEDVPEVGEEPSAEDRMEGENADDGAA